MRSLVLMRGAPGCGKSTWIEKMGWTDYALCADTLRLLIQSPVIDNAEGKLQISQKNDRYVWDLLMELLEKRMERGEFCVIDATHSKSSDFAKYKKLREKYRYRMYCIDFTDVPLETCMERNLQRPEHKHVPKAVIENMYARFRNQDIPGYVKVVNHNDMETVNSLVADWQPTNVDEYEKIVVFGDIHGCFKPLQEWFEQHPFSEKNLYVFVGDYIDRGLENDKVVEWLLQNYEKKNITLLEGNHERWLREYADGDYDEELKIGKKDRCKSTQFFEKTSKQLAGFDKKDLRQLCRRFQTIAWLSFKGKRLLISHCGVGYQPANLQLTAASNFISDNDYKTDIDALFEERLKDKNLYQIHGHRNAYHYKLGEHEHSINLNGEVELGGCFRVVEIEE